MDIVVMGLLYGTSMVMHVIICIPLGILVCLFVILYSHYTCTFKTTLFKIFNLCIKKPIPPATHFSYLFTYPDRFTFILTLFIPTFHNITFLHSIFRLQMSSITTHDRVSAIQTYIVIVLTIILSELSAILMNFIHLLENRNSGSITPARCGNKLQ